MSTDNPTPYTFSTRYTLFFMVGLSFICALILSILASALKEPQENAKELDRNKQLLIAARILSPYGFFLVRDENGIESPAKFSAEGYLIPTQEKTAPSGHEIMQVFKKRIIPFLINAKGMETTFQQAGLNEQKYTAEFKKVGYYTQPEKLIYKILSNVAKEKDSSVEGYAIPLNGMGLWDAIYGFIAFKPDGNTVIGTTWYDQKETPGLGANIADPPWQSQFPGKHLFQESPDGETNFKSAPLGIVVIKGNVREVLGSSPKAFNSVDGMAGATLTGNGVTNAFKDSLGPYRIFLIKIHDAFQKQASGEHK